MILNMAEGALKYDMVYWAIIEAIRPETLQRADFDPKKVDVKLIINGDEADLMHQNKH